MSNKKHLCKQFTFSVRSKPKHCTDIFEDSLNIVTVRASEVLIPLTSELTTYFILFFQNACCFNLKIYFYLNGNAAVPGLLHLILLSLAEAAEIRSLKAQLEWDKVMTILLKSAVVLKPNQQTKTPAFRISA